ncbi:MAG TPA: alpha/beta fold hydrolase [Bacteroidales bacterium]|nr:alpha/beta fold hydrolase [Bacteroidales bacterium]HPT21533.1 alpha/beta fold hydrolase [Bacteroidales bacterium]
MKLFYRKYGEGPPLVILHGLYGSSDNWVTIAKKISDRFTVYLPDQRNHGHSPHSEIHDYESMSNDLSELASDLKLGKFYLAGHSMGGKTATAFALRWPERLSGLLIADISPFANKDTEHNVYYQHLSVLKIIQSFDLKSISTRQEAELLISEKIPSEKIRNFILKNLQRTTGNDFAWRINVPSLIDNLENIIQGIDSERYIGHPVTGFHVIFLKGEKSDYLPSEDFISISKVFPSAKFVSISGSGHWVHSDSPGQVIIQLLELLKGH